MQSILFVDDDKNFQSVIAEILMQANYLVDLASNAAEGLKLYKMNQYNLVISDIKMGTVDGLQFVELIRQLNSDVKIILMTASDEEDDEVRGLQLKINDFIKKPVRTKVLLTRIDRVLNNNIFAEQVMLLKSERQKITVDLNSRKVYKNNQLVELTMLEYDLLVYLLKNRNKVLSREQIMRDVWRGTGFSIDSRNVDTHIKKLRGKLNISSIFSIRGIGYEWTE